MLRLRCVRRLLLAPVLLAVAILAPAPSALAVGDCQGLPPVTTVASGQGRLESVISDAGGRLFFTDVIQNRLLRLDAPGAQPVVLATDIPSPGGLAWNDAGDLVVGYNGAGFFAPPGNGMSGLYVVDPDTGEKRQFASGFDQANGLARSSAGSYYASNIVSGEIVRVSPTGAPSHWTTVSSANGLVIDGQSRYLYVATSLPSKVVRVRLADPLKTTDWYDASQDPEILGFDGLTRDGTDRLFVAANTAGQIWRIDGQRQACAIARGLVTPSAVAFGGSSTEAGFSARNLYVVTHAGDVLELAGVAGRPRRTRP